MTRGEGRRQEDTGTLGSSGPDLTTSGPCSPERGWGAAGAFHGGGGISPRPRSAFLGPAEAVQPAGKGHKHALK